MEPLELGKSQEGQVVAFNPALMNRHGLIAGATGTGKTVTLQVLAERLSKMGTSIFLTDIKGDLSGLSKQGELNDKISARLKSLGDLSFSPSANPVNFIDMFAKNGHGLKITPSAMGPLLFAKLLELNETQAGVLHIAFKYADEEGLLLLDLKDLKSVLSLVAENANEIRKEYGNVSSQSVGAIQRRLLVLEEQGGDQFFGEPEFDIHDLLIKDFSGQGLIHVFDATELLERPKVYASFLLWLLSELFESLDEVGDLPSPKLALFFDEAHLLFNDLPKELLERIETVVRLIRSKGVGVYFVTQNPDDIPESVLSQLGHRVQHALRAFTASDNERIRKISKNFRVTPGLDVRDVITNLGTGEALISGLSEKGEPLEVVRTIIRPPESKIGPITLAERAEVMSRSMLNSKYNQEIDRESAYEVLKKRTEETAAKELEENKPSFWASLFGGSSGSSKTTKRTRQGAGEAFVKSMVRTIGSQVGREILRGVMGTMSKK